MKNPLYIHFLSQMFAIMEINCPCVLNRCILAEESYFIICVIFYLGLYLCMIYVYSTLYCIEYYEEHKQFPPKPISFTSLAALAGSNMCLCS